MKFTFELTEQDYIDFNLFFTKNSRAIKRQRIILWVLFTIVPVMAGLIDIFFKRKGNINIFTIYGFCFLLLLSIVFFFLFPKIWEKIIYRNVKKVMRDGTKNNILGERSIIFEEDNFNLITKYEKIFMTYKKIAEIKQSDVAIYLYTSPTTALIMPLRIFSSEKEKNNFISFIESKLW